MTTPLEAIIKVAESEGVELPRNGAAPSGGAPVGSGDFIHRVADHLSVKDRFAADVAGRLMVYRHGVYVEGEAYVKRQCKRIANEWKVPQHWSKRKADEVIEYLRVDAPLIPTMPDPDILNVRNGLVDITDPSHPFLTPHGPEFLSTVQFPMDYDDKAPGPEVVEVQEFLSMVLPMDCMDFVLELFGVLMVPGLARRWAILLYGEGGTGKSTFLKLVTAFIGKDQITNLPLHKLENERFARARIVGKPLNIFADLPDKHLDNTSIFRMITGGDRLDAELKHRDGFDFEPVTRLLMSANAYPRSADASDAFFDRWLVVPFARRFRDVKGEVDQDELLKRLTRPAEQSWLLNQAIEGLARFKGRDDKYEVPASVKASMDDFRATTTPLAVWLDRNVISIPDAMISADALFSAYKAFVEVSNSPDRLPQTTFGRELRRVRPKMFNHASHSQRTVNGVPRTWVWLGVGLIANG